MFDENLKKRYFNPHKFSSHYPDYVYAKKVCKELEIKDLGECHDLYV